MLDITSPTNPRLKHIAALRQRRDRDRAQQLLVEGADELALAFASGAQAEMLVVCPALQDQPERLAAWQPLARETLRVTPALFKKIAYRDHPDGWLAVFTLPQRTLANLSLSNNPLILVVEGVEKPGNLGAMFRSADAAGVDALVVCDPLTDVANPNTVRASRGTVFTVPWAVSPSAAVAAWLQAHHIQRVAATPQASTRYTDINWLGPMAVVVGEEHNGLSKTWLTQADLCVQIPMVGRVNSLNVSTAATLLLYEAVRQRGG